MDGSVILNAAEKMRPEMAGLDDLIERIAQAKEVIDAGNAELGSGPLSWADLMVLAAKVAVQAEWKYIKVRITQLSLSTFQMPVDNSKAGYSSVNSTCPA